MSDLDLAGQRVLIREDLNVPIKNGKVSSDARLRASIATIKAAAQLIPVILLIRMNQLMMYKPTEDILHFPTQKLFVDLPVEI